MSRLVSYCSLNLSRFSDGKSHCFSLLSQDHKSPDRLMSARDSVKGNLNKEYEK